jgi:predicted lipid-binding transport protein (Tim44 family)
MARRRRVWWRSRRSGDPHPLKSRKSDPHQRGGFTWVGRETSLTGRRPRERPDNLGRYHAGVKDYDPSRPPQRFRPSTAWSRGGGLPEFASRCPSRSAAPPSEGRHAMMDQMMGGAMMWGMGLLSLLAVIVLILAIAALVKYLFSVRGTKP